MISSEQLKKYEQDGFLVLENFLSIENCDLLRKECDIIITSNDFQSQIKDIPIFSTNFEYLLLSGNKIRPFLEKDAAEILKRENRPVIVFNKIGHALHALNPVFKEITFGSNVKDLLKSMSFKKPIVFQSMYIFKERFIGGEVIAHQDASYSYVEPLKEVGIWIALEDCTIDNGCLQFIPGSHKGELTTRLIRNPDKEEFDSGKFLIYTKGSPRDLKFDDDLFVPVPVKAGDAIMIDGLVVHKSGPNVSPKSRHIYAFHVYDSENATFSKDNWMENNPETFLELY